MTFHRPVRVGDEAIRVTEGLFTYVRVDAGGRPTPVAA